MRQPPLLVTVDHEGGRVQRFRDGFFRLPPMRTLGHLYDEDPAAALQTAASFGWLMAAELRALGIDMSFTPVVERDLGLAAVIGDRALHPAPEAVASLALRFAAGAKQAGMAITAKHFPTHAGAKSDSHTEFAVDRREISELLDDLYPYQRLIEAGLQASDDGARELPGRRCGAGQLVAMVDQHTTAWRAWIRRRRDQRRPEHGRSGRGRVGRGAVRVALEAGCDLVLLCNAGGSSAGRARGAARLRESHVSDTPGAPAWPRRRLLGRLARVERMAGRVRRAATAVHASRARAAGMSGAAQAADALEAAAARRRARLLHSARTVDRAIVRMAKEITAALATAKSGRASCHAWRRVHGDCVGIALQFPTRVRLRARDAVRERAYGGAVDWRVRPSARLAGRTVLIVDDILDRGVTLAALQEDLSRIGVARQLLPCSSSSN